MYHHYQEKSERGKQGAKNNKYRHRLGSRGYQRSFGFWEKTKRISTSTPSNPESSTASDAQQLSGTGGADGKITDRSLAWVLARQVKLPDGSWGIDPKDKPTLEIANSVVSSIATISFDYSFLFYFCNINVNIWHRWKICKRCLQ